MVPLQRLPEPAILLEKKDPWTAAFRKRRDGDPRARPWSSQYAHADIVEALAAMSGWKCFYCECDLKAPGHEVDHYIEVAERPDDAFAWSNLYLACKACNNKLPNQTIPAAECLDPCAPGCAPAEHLAFDDEIIRPRGGSLRGDKTIRKYKLDDAHQDHQRLRQLKVFLKAHAAIIERCRAEGGRPLSEAERELLCSFATPGRPFSLMFTFYLRNAGLLSSP